MSLGNLAPSTNNFSFPDLRHFILINCCLSLFLNFRGQLLVSGARWLSSWKKNAMKTIILIYNAWKNFFNFDNIFFFFAKGMTCLTLWKWKVNLIQCCQSKNPKKLGEGLDYLKTAMGFPIPTVLSAILFQFPRFSPPFFKF